MPFVSITYRSGKINAEISEIIKGVICDQVVKHFSIKDLELTEHDLSFVFHEAGTFDELTHDIIVNISLHFFPDRLIISPDTNADRIAKRLTTELRNLSVGVSLIFAEIGWGTGD